MFADNQLFLNLFSLPAWPVQAALRQRQIEVARGIRPANTETIVIGYHGAPVEPASGILHPLERVVSAEKHLVPPHHFKCVPECGIVEKAAGRDQEVLAKVFAKRPLAAIATGRIRHSRIDAPEAVRNKFSQVSENDIEI
jgi:hypothetical protein